MVATENSISVWMLGATVVACAAASSALGWALERQAPLIYYSLAGAIVMSWLPIAKAVRSGGFARSVAVGLVTGYVISLFATW